jgi:hypothetical protein
MATRSVAERLDRAVDQILGGADPAPDGDLRPMLDAAASLRGALVPVPASTTFSRRLAARLEGAGPIARLAEGTDRLLGRAESAARGALRDRGRLIAAGAVSSVAGAAVAGVAVWMVTRRGTGHGPAHR